MKSIELTQEHRTKLLEMCKILFSDNIIEIHGGSCDHSLDDVILIWDKDKYWKISDWGLKHPNWYSCNRIHWFEFCMTHLVDKIYSLAFIAMKEKNILWDLVTKEGFYLQVLHPKYELFHPIDYLYEQFKKLKL